MLWAGPVMSASIPVAQPCHCELKADDVTGVCRDESEGRKEQPLPSILRVARYTTGVDREAPS
jgi:hypothetical protein